MIAKKKWWIAGIACLLVCLLIPFCYLLRERQLDEIRDEALKKLEWDIGQYDDRSIVLHNTSPVKAKKLAEQFGATLRITKDGRFATLTLPEGVTIRDIYAREDAHNYIEDMAADYQVQVSELNEGETEEFTGKRIPARPTCSVSDSDYELQSYLDYLNMQNVWNTYTGTGVTVAVIDTGIDTDHPEFSGRISEYSYNATEDKIVKDWLCEDGGYDWSLIEDEQGHGTAVTGVIAASMNSGKVVGIAPDVNIIVIKAECDKNGVFKRTSDLVFGLYYAIERNVQVVNMSFGGGSLADWKAPVQLAYDSDIICVAAAGNNGTSALAYPAACEKVIGVGALASDSWTLADYSNYGENSDIVAPGTTYTTLIDGTYGTQNGTSLATPAVTAAVALYMQNNQYVAVDQVTEVLFASCYDLGNLGNDWEYGYGALDLSAFLLEERGTVTYDMLSDELENEEGFFIRGHALQELPEPERLYAVFDGWYYDDTFTQAVEYYTDAFYGDLTLYAKWVNEDDGVPYTYVVLDDGTVEIRSYTGHRRYITVPERIDGRVVSSIGDFAFSGQSRLREVTLPRGLTKIGRYAFENCANLISIEIPEGVTQIGESAFINNVRLHTVAFLGNSSLEEIGDFAFAHCSSLERIDFHASLTSVNGTAFYGAVALRTIQVYEENMSFSTKDGVLFNATEDTLIAYPAAKSRSYTVPECVNTIGVYAFAYAELNTVELSSVREIQKGAFIYSQLVEVCIPDEIVSVKAEAFFGNANLSQVSLGRGLTCIEQSVFESCGSLSNIAIPSQIVNIGVSSFKGSGLANVVFEGNSSLLSIDPRAFAYCKIREITLPDSLVTINDAAFFCSELEKVTFSKNSELRFVGNEAFRNCAYLTEISLPAKLKTIGSLAFAKTGLAAVTIPQSVTTLGGGAFAYNKDLPEIFVEEGNLVYHSINGVVYTIDNKTLVQYPTKKAATSYDINESTRTVAPYAFAGTVNLLNVTLPMGMEILSEYSFCDAGIQHISLPVTLTEIQQYSFSGCSGLTTLSIPDNVIQIGRYAVAECGSLSTVTFNPTSKLPRIGYGAFAYSGIRSFTVPANVSTIDQGAFVGCDKLTAITFAENSKLESISAHMFNGCGNLQRITFETGSKLTSIQAHALEGMTKLNTIDFGDAKVTNLDNFAFRFCESLSALTLPDTLTNIGRYAFYSCKSLSELTVPVNVENIGGYAFLGTNDLDLYLASDSMPAYLEENWDYGIKGYYVGVTSVETVGDYRYAILTSGNLTIIEYLGIDTRVDLSTLELGAPIVAIGGSAFEDSAVTSIVLPDTLTEIQAEAFRYTDITGIVIPSGVTFIGREAFAHTALETLSFAEDSVLAVIEQYAFEDTEKLKAVVLPATLKTMGTGAFMESGLETVTFAEGILLTEIPKNAFAETKLTAVTLPDSVTLVNHNAFYNVQSLQNVAFGDNDGISLMSNAFYHTGLTTVRIPANVTYIGEACFVALSNSTEFSVEESNPNYISMDGLLLDKSGRKLIAVPAGRTGSLTVPLTVEEIGFGAFEESKLSKIIFHQDANILALGHRAFFKAELLTEITIPSSVVSIDSYAFAYCKNLKTVTFAEGNKLKGIYEGAFLCCTNLTDIALPEAIAEILDFAFYGCAKINRIPIAEDSEIKGVYDYAFAYSGITGTFTTPETLIDIGDYAFLSTKVTKVTIPDTHKKDLVIGIGAFEECNKLEEITLPFVGASFEDEKISWFGYIFGAGAYTANEAFVPKSLKTVTVTEGVTGIYAGGFANCTGLEVIKVPHSVCLLGPGSFANTTAKYELTNAILTTWSNGYTDGYVTGGCFGKGIEGTVRLADGTIGLNNAFKDCSNLEHVILPDSVISIGTAFSGCTGLQSVTIPDGVTSIESWAFRNCRSLKEIILPSGVVSIGEYAFEYCSSLEDIVIPESVTSIGDTAFYGCEKLYVVHNNSSLVLTPGSSDHGWVASYANVIIDKNGNKTYRETDSGFVYVDTADGFRFYKEYDAYTLTSYHGTENTVQLPDNINGQSYSIKNFTGAEHVIIPGTVSKIDGFAFRNSNLQSVTMLEGVATLAQTAFYNCESLVSVELPSSVSSIGSDAFFECSSLEKIIVNENNDRYCSIDGIVYDQINKRIVVVPEGKKGTVVIPHFITKIDNGFVRCHNVNSIEIHDQITYISDSAFANENLETIIVSENNQNYCMLDGILYDKELTRAYWASPSLEGTVTLPESLDRICSFAFSNCGKITDIQLPNKLRFIEDNAFSGCTNLRSITLPSSVTSIGSAFGKSPNLERIDITSLEAWCNMGRSGSGFGYDFDLYLNGILLEDIVVPNSITSNLSYAFAGCRSLKRVVLQDGITSIGSSAFYRCSNLESIELPDSITSIGREAFYACSSLESIKIPYGVTTIEYLTFEYCESLKHVEIPNSVTTIERNAFIRCGIESIIIPDSVTSIGKFAFAECDNLIDVRLPKDITEIEDSTFNQCRFLRSINIPSKVKRIGQYAFQNCDALFEIHNFSTLELSFGSADNGEIALVAKLIVDKNGNKTYAKGCYEYEVFETADGFKFIKMNGEYSLIAYTGTNETITLPASINGKSYTISRFRGGTHVIIPHGITTIGEYAFYGCNTLKSVEIPDSVTSIGFMAFAECRNLESITIPHSVTRIAAGAFSNCVGLTNVRLPNGITTIENTTFANCASLKSIKIPDSVTAIAHLAFEQCTQLESVNIPDSVTCIGENAFSGTACLKNPDNWSNGMLIFNGWLFGVSEDLTYHSLEDIKGIRGVSYDAYKNAILLKNPIWASGNIRGASNAETLLVSNFKYSDYFERGVPSTQYNITLKNIVVLRSVGATELYEYPNIFSALSGVTIYVEALEDELRWDENFPGWNNGNVVVYGDEWTWANFYDENGNIIHSVPRRNSQIIRRPIYQKEETEQYAYEMVGWDLDGDGVADDIPATSITDIHATAIVNRFVKTYRVIFKDSETGEVYYQADLPYGTVIVPPVAPDREDTFLEGWNGYVPGMTVTENCEFSAKWHVHHYETTVMAPTCTDRGHSTHICYCGNSYVDSYVNELGHNMGEWYETTAPTCTVVGEVQRDCSRCDHVETNELAALGHNKVQHTAQSATCTAVGWNAYETCSRCDYTTYAEIPATGHSYTSVVTNPTCTSQGYTTHSCRCGNSYVDSYVNELGHNMGEWYETTAPTCTVVGEVQRDCSRCDHVETDELPVLGHSKVQHTAQSATCTAIGWNAYETCSRCDYTTYAEIPAKGHSYVHTVVSPTIENEGYTIHSCTVCGSHYSDNFVDRLTYTVGDIDGNETIDKDDAIYLLMATFFPEDYPLEQDCDFDGNNKVDKDDAIYLLMYTFFPNDYPLTAQKTTVYALIPTTKRDEE